MYDTQYFQAYVPRRMYVYVSCCWVGVVAVVSVPVFVWFCPSSSAVCRDSSASPCVSLAI